MPQSDICLKKLDHRYLPEIRRMESASDARDFVTPQTQEEHLTEMNNPDIDYLAISNSNDELLGFIILVLEVDNRSVELRRIVVEQKGAGTGTRAMKLAEEYCRNELRRSRIWLDVYDINPRGRHVYEGLGYQYLRTEMSNNKPLHFFEKNLN